MKFKEAIRHRTARTRSASLTDVVAELNSVLRGWNPVLPAVFKDLATCADAGHLRKRETLRSGALLGGHTMAELVSLPSRITMKHSPGVPRANPTRTSQVCAETMHGSEEGGHAFPTPIRQVRRVS